MSVTPIDLQAYLAVHDLLVEEIEGLTDEQLHWKPAPDKWSVLEVLTHLTDHNIVVTFRIRELLANSTAALPAFSQDDWVSGQHANAAEVSELLFFFRQLLIYNHRLFSRLDAADWQKSGLNFKGQVVSVADVVQAFINHAIGHLAQIKRNKDAVRGLHTSD
ncbi:DinB family protein [Cohnella abietis]|uniref:DinB-like domain-containing protein n=1 Tax=Cohnella abietis TaxID=2507935 RepID=A0A3T1DBS7_9BACL|nr:DinB family protein [Cohnella abietis]BBI35552.1 hypothetical protein KCTCHS21_49510 [Cohnella abietis]